VVTGAGLEFRLLDPKVGASIRSVLRPRAQGGDHNVVNGREACEVGDRLQRIRALSERNAGRVAAEHTPHAVEQHRSGLGTPEQTIEKLLPVVNAGPRGRSCGTVPRAPLLCHKLRSRRVIWERAS
jgi:hypothetical protein